LRARRVYILSDGSVVEEVVLEDDVDVRPEFLETELTGVFPVYEDLAT
jgi:hypothetical protein